MWVYAILDGVLIDTSLLDNTPNQVVGCIIQKRNSHWIFLTKRKIFTVDLLGLVKSKMFFMQNNKAIINL